MSRRTKARLGISGYAAVLVALKRRPMTRMAMQQAGLAGRTALQRIVGAFRRARLIHVSGWETRMRCAPEPVFSLGGGRDAPVPRTRSNGKPVLHVWPESAAIANGDLAQFVRLLRHMHSRHGHMTMRQACDRFGFDDAALSPCFKVLHAGGLLPIRSWLRVHDKHGRPCGRPLPVHAFSLRGGGDCPRPAPKTRAQINTAYRRSERGATVAKMAAKGIRVKRGAPIIFVPPKPGRYAITGPVEGTITADWLARRAATRDAQCSPPST